MTIPLRVLLTVSGSVPADLDRAVAEGRRPQADYRAISVACGADVVDVDEAVAGSGVIGRLLRRLGGAGPALAWYAFRRRRRYDVVLTDGEQVGVPYAALTRVFGRRACRHVMIVHVVSVPFKARLIRLARLASRIDEWIVYSSLQRSFIVERFGVRPSSVHLTTFMVDTEFFQPVQGAERRRLVVSAGLERRDYATMMEAVAGIDADVVIAAASPWSSQRDSTADRALPHNVEVRRLDLFDLRQLYAEASLLVMPLVDNDFQAGITTILEAMAMSLPVVCTRTPGQTDTLIDGVTGVYVPVGDPDAMRTAIVDVLDDPDLQRRLGAAARDWAVEHADVRVYAQRLAGIVERAAE